MGRKKGSSDEEESSASRSESESESESESSSNSRSEGEESASETSKLIFGVFCINHFEQVRRVNLLVLRMRKMASPLGKR